MLFIIFINHFFFKFVIFFIYADETNAVLPHPDLDQLINSLNSELSDLSIWFKVNKLSLNVNKSNYMVFVCFCFCLFVCFLVPFFKSS